MRSLFGKKKSILISTKISVSFSKIVICFYSSLLWKSWKVGMWVIVIIDFSICCNLLIYFLASWSIFLFLTYGSSGVSSSIVSSTLLLYISSFWGVEIVISTSMLFPLFVNVDFFSFMTCCTSIQESLLSNLYFFSSPWWVYVASPVEIIMLKISLRGSYGQDISSSN
jgi:hypothetical protein